VGSVDGWRRVVIDHCVAVSTTISAEPLVDVGGRSTPVRTLPETALMV
jgi:hypothetical protein